jgi:hypothetical protein
MRSTTLVFQGNKWVVLVWKQQRDSNALSSNGK